MPSIQSQRRSKSKRNNPNGTSTPSSYPQATGIDETSKQAFNYGVLRMHDPKLAQIFATSSICNVYKYSMERSEWEKLECQGTLFVYSRQQNVNAGAAAGATDKTQAQGTGKRRKRKNPNASQSATPTIEQQQELQEAAPESQPQQQQQPEFDQYPYALTVLNRLSLENFSLGITPLCFSEKYDLPEMDVKLEEPFIMVEGTDGGMYGLWVFHENDRPYIEQVIRFCLDAKF